MHITNLFTQFSVELTDVSDTDPLIGKTLSEAEAFLKDNEIFFGGKYLKVSMYLRLRLGLLIFTCWSNIHSHCIVFNRSCHRICWAKIWILTPIKLFFTGQI